MAPYSFPLSGGYPSMEWTLNGSLAQTGAFITLRPKGEGGGKAQLSVTATSPESSDDVPSVVTQDISLLYGTQKKNIFGL